MIYPSYNSFPKIREVEINGHQLFYKGVFHGWTYGQKDGQFPMLLGIIENQDGVITYVEPHCITFVDKFNFL